MMRCSWDEVLMGGLASLLVFREGAWHIYSKEKRVFLKVCICRAQRDIHTVHMYV